MVLTKSNIGPDGSLFGSSPSPWEPCYIIILIYIIMLSYIFAVALPLMGKVTGPDNNSVPIISICVYSFVSFPWVVVGVWSVHRIMLFFPLVVVIVWTVHHIMLFFPWVVVRVWTVHRVQPSGPPVHGDQLGQHWWSGRCDRGHQGNCHFAFQTGRPLQALHSSPASKRLESLPVVHFTVAMFAYFVLCEDCGYFCVLLSL